MWRHARALAVLAALSLAACTGPAHPAAAPTPPTSATLDLPAPGPTTTARVLCNGSAGETLLRGLLAALGAGRRVDLTAYFSPPESFVRWFDPSDPAIVTFLPGPGSETFTLDALQARLDKLSRAGLSARLTGFTDGGYQAGAVGEEGGWFAFDLRGRGGRSGPDSDGGGKGAVDCASGKLKVLVIDGW